MPAPFGWEKKGSNPFLISYYSEEGNFKHTAGTWERKTGDQAYGIMGGETSSAADIPLSVVQQMGERQFGVRPLGPDGIRAGTSTRDPTYGDGLSDRLRAENSKAVEEVGKWGVSPAALKKIPSEWGEGVPNKKGEGFRWTDPTNQGNGVRIDRGNPNNSQVLQQVDHVLIRKDGQVIGPDGKPLPGPIKKFLEAHIPLSEWEKWSTWYEP